MLNRSTSQNPPFSHPSENNDDQIINIAGEYEDDEENSDGDGDDAFDVDNDGGDDDDGDLYSKRIP